MLKFLLEEHRVPLPSPTYPLFVSASRTERFDVLNYLLKVRRLSLPTLDDDTLYIWPSVLEWIQRETGVSPIGFGRKDFARILQPYQDGKEEVDLKQLQQNFEYWYRIAPSNVGSVVLAYIPDFFLPASVWRLFVNHIRDRTKLSPYILSVSKYSQSYFALETVRFLVEECEMRFPADYISSQPRIRRDVWDYCIKHNNCK